MGQSYPKSQLLGREALATITIDEGGWAKITNLSARPMARPAAPVAVLTPPAPVQSVADDQLPF